MLTQYHKFWWALYAGLFAMLLTELFLGPRSFHLQEAQRAEITSMEHNYQDLQALQVMLEAIKYDHEHNDETIILEARKVGFFKPNEALIVVKGIKNLADNWEIGHVIRQETQHNPSLRWYGIFAFIVSFCLVLMAQFLLHKNED